MSDITVTPTDKIFAIGVANAYMSADGGENWVVNSDGLDKFSGFMPEYYITYSPDGYLYAGGKFGQVIFRSANPVNASAPEAMKSYTTKLNQNYPNPFNSITTITYSIPKDCLVRLKVFDTLGNEVSQLVNEFKKAGEYRVNFNAGNLSSGVYLYKLFAGEYSAGKKFILVK
ncbi:MAG: T9SS type A sorting domain-containing protein [Ignavibacteria bacterium]|nr:T9SS type A sorting domain-containing protein [Ignavibacteria bacterium]MCU7497654.1 T9SS type A sorting domain-containing protein [Ignavibacteria bacterium]MCU7518895.1 T9SS type A sorting domain-containing protein [Ignavibacteria bacterium]MCU7523137.1 T9SS type A sorting domain-containing protein [Ignavibacteria bacterium]